MHCTKLAVVTTHPIQYNAPYFKLLAGQTGLLVKVFYTWSQSRTGPKFDKDFNRTIEWDIPLLDSYEYTFVNNIAVDPGSHHYKGIDNPSLNKEIEHWQADTLLIIGWSYKSHFGCMRYFKNKIPILFRGDSTLLDERPGIKQIIRRLFLTYVYTYIDHALYVGVENKKYFLKHGIKETQLFFAPHAIDNDRFSNDNLYAEKVLARRKELKIGNEDFVVLFAGKFETKKNPEYIINLAAAMPDKNLKFILAGNGILENDLKTKAAADKRIIFLDFQNQQSMPVLYRLAKIFVLPSKGPGETWGLCVNEAMACRCPIIVSDKAGCASDLIKKNGIVISPDDILAGKEYINHLLADKMLQRQEGAQSLEIIKKYSFSAIVHAITSVISKT